MLGWNSKKRAADLARQLDKAHQTIAGLRSDLGTHEYNARTAITRRDEADNRTAKLRAELVKEQATSRRLRETNAALEQRVAELQAANEAAYIDLAARSGANGSAEIPPQREDGAA